MKKTLKIAGAVLLSLIGLIIIAFLLVRFCFRDRVAGFLNEKLPQEHIELLQAAAPYVSEIGRASCRERV